MQIIADKAFHVLGNDLPHAIMATDPFIFLAEDAFAVGAATGVIENERMNHLVEYCASACPPACVAHYHPKRQPDRRLSLEQRLGICRADSTERIACPG